MLRRSCCLAIALLLLVIPVSAVETSAMSAILMDADSGRVLYEHNADQQMLIASTTKIMTALVAIRNGNLSDEVIVSASAAGTEGSSMYLQSGERLSLEELLYGLLLCSGNDAAVAVAEHIGGSVPAFVEKMNAMAADLGMTSSSFANPNGLDHADHYSTARDMARLAQAALKEETLLRIASTRSVTIGGRTMTNHNKLLWYQSGCIGMKTGYTRAAGRTLVSCAEKNGQRLIAITLQDGNDWADHQSLYEYGFAVYPAHTAAILGCEVERAPVLGGIDTVPLVAAEGFSWPLREGEKIVTSVCLKAPLIAPVRVGTPVGDLVFSLNGKEIGRVELLCGETVLPELASAMGALKLKLPE